MKAIPETYEKTVRVKSLFSVPDLLSLPLST